MENARYTCSKSMTRAKLCGKVIGDIDILKSQPRLKLSANPNELPTIKFTVEIPLVPKLSSF